MRRLSSLGSRHLAHRKGRSILTAAGIVLGVAILFGVLVSNATTKAGVDRLVRDFTGAADVLVRPSGAFDATMSASTLDRLARLPQVRAAVGSFRFDSSVRTPAVREAEAIVVRGIDLQTARRIQDYVLIRGHFFAPGAREVVIPERLRATLRVRVGDALRVATPYGVQSVRLVGVLADSGAGRTDQGEVAFTSLEAARGLARVGAVVSGARLALDEGVDTEPWIERHRIRGLDFENANELAKGFQQFLDVLGAVFTFFAAITLFVGAFLIYLTLSMAVIERTRVYGTMRALGATRAQVRRVVMTEAFALGAVSTALGLAVGLLIARGFLGLFSTLFEIDLPGLTVRPRALVAGVAIGLVTTLGSSLVPARRASRLSPVVAMRGDYASETRLSRAWIAGATFFALGVATSLATPGLGSPLVLLGAVLLTPPLLRPVARLLGRLTNRLARGVGDVAVLHLVKERSRSAYTLALIMVVMAVIFSVGGLNATLRRAMLESLDRQFGADLTIHPAGGTNAFATFSGTFERELRAVPGVGRVTGVRFGQISLPDARGDHQAFARIIDPETYFDVAGFLFREGTAREAQRALAGGGSVLIPTERARSLRTGVGGSLRVRTAAGVRAFRVAGTYTSFGGPPETVFGLGDGRRYLNAGAAHFYQLNVSPGAEPEEVGRRIERDLGARYNLDVETAGDIKRDAERQFGRFFTIFYAILLVAAVVGLLGLANTLAMSVLQRYREIGVLRAIGTTRGQVRRMVLVESATLGLVAFVLALPLGLLLSILTVRGISEVFGFEVAYVYPATWVPGVIAFGVVVAVLAAIAPGRRAARLEIVGALQYE